MQRMAVFNLRRKIIFALLLTTFLVGLGASTAFAQNFAIVNKDPGDDKLQCTMLCGGTAAAPKLFTFKEARVREVLTQRGEGTLIVTCTVDFPEEFDDCGLFPESAFQVTEDDGFGSCYIDSDNSEELPDFDILNPGTKTDRFIANLSPTGRSTLQCVKVIDPTE